MIQEGAAREEIDAALKTLDESAAADLRQELKRFFILEKIAEQEKVYATEDDVDLQVGLLAKAISGRSARSRRSWRRTAVSTRSAPRSGTPRCSASCARRRRWQMRPAAPRRRRARGHPGGVVSGGPGSSEAGQAQKYEIGRESRTR